MKILLTLLALRSLILLPLSAETYLARNKEELTTHLESARPGDTVQLASGKWANLQLNLTLNGRAEAPIIISGATNGSTLITKRSHIGIAGKHIVLSHLVFDQVEPPENSEAIVSFRTTGGNYAYHSRLRHCVFDSCNPADPNRRYSWVRLYGTDNRVDHNLFRSQSHEGVTIQVRILIPGAKHRIDHNHFMDRPKGDGNGFECIQIGQSQDSMSLGSCLVENNLFERCDGETEIISSKTGGNVIRGNLFYESAGTLTLRHGNDNLVENNTFIGNGKADTGGVRIIGTGHTVRQNTFAGLTGYTGGVIVLYSGIPDSPLNGYFAADRALIEDNQFYKCQDPHVQEKGGYNERGRTILPQDYRIHNNNTLDSPPDYSEFLHRMDVGPDWQTAFPDLGALSPRQIARLVRSIGEEFRPLLQETVARADQLLAAGKTYTVTSNERLPPSGDMRSYYSTGPYWWSNPDTPDGLPYIRRDGQFNPERDLVSDRPQLHAMVQDTWTLAIAYLATGNQSYAQHAEAILRVWFIDDATRMLPNLDHAQAIPGVTDGRGTGIIDTLVFVELVDALKLLELSFTWPPAERLSVKTWFSEYLEWLSTHPNGLDERAAKNNHGTAYDLQQLAIADYLGRVALAREIIERVKTQRIDKQITAIGEQPLEYARTRSWSYCTENLEHFARISAIALDYQVNLFEYQNPQGGSLTKALELLLPHACDPATSWPGKQLTAWQSEYIYTATAIAASITLNQSFSETLDCIEPAENQLLSLLMLQ
ncbi:chondroitinase-B domain-containing protein [Pelagicoccus sp. SDUM812002]|uniref:chondroitinase-B domain-containing protein n=1 Tax=Pelagicoccus sp. SDUM812002 TaxID=3041266 RepID=UPI00280E63FA|nr:chondroitinase-B domain-containing protein [Pelagicoccus sp. SDUM812002]MDQ8187905.1 chondroitinase-B domain-containing protein [Pelagicoccus sp. SDUM812002]